MSFKFLTAAWEDLIMANYVVDSAILKPLLPAKTEIDLFNDKAYVSLVGFMFNNTRVLGMKIPFHVNFEEVNLRFYVKFNDNGQWKRGTVFIREIVPRPAISIIANTLYHEKYATMPMKHEKQEADGIVRLSYQWKHQQKWNRIEATVDNSPHPMIEGSKEEFITEHYWGYSRYNEATTYEYNVQHPTWKIYPVRNSLVDCDFGALYGDAFAGLTTKNPDFVLVAQGSPIAIMNKKKL